MRCLAGMALALAAVAAGCGGAGGDVEPAGATAPVGTSPPLTEVEVGIVSVDRALDELRFEVTTEPLPGPDGEGDCGIELVDRTDEQLVEPPPPVVVTVVASRSDGEPFSAGFEGFAGCPSLAPRTVTVDVRDPLGDRPVVVDQPAHLLWLATAGGAFAPCVLPACDPVTGQPPDPDGCDQTLVDAARAGDVPAHAGIDVPACAGGFAVVDVDLGAGECPATGDGAPNPCAGQRVDRTYWSRSADGTWQQVGYGERGVPGCSGPPPAAFPEALCETLPPTPE